MPAPPVDTAAPPVAAPREEVPRPHRLEPGVGVALGLSFLVGVGVSVQAFCNGRLAGELGSLELAGLANMVTGGTALVVLAVVSGAARRAVRRVREGRRLSWWMFLGGFSGALMVMVTTKAAPEVGIALMTVAVVCGQSGGSLVVDWLGLSPAGRHGVSAPRLAGVVLAVGAVAVGAVAAHTEPRPALLAVLVGAGGAFAVQQAINARLGRTVGEPLAAAMVNFGVGFAVLAVVTLIVVGGGPPRGWGAPPLDWIGGLLGAAFVIVSALVVPVIGVLRLTLAAVAGQSAGALALDLVAPAPGEAVSVGTVVGVLLALAAVGVSSVGPPAGGRRRTAAG
jgi:bacterial/archaeal transporter family-2 protein